MAQVTFLLYTDKSVWDSHCAVILGKYLVKILYNIVNIITMDKEVSLEGVLLHTYTINSLKIGTSTIITFMS